MGKLEERESRRISSVVGSMVEAGPEAAKVKKGRPKADREIKKRVSLAVLPSLYEDIQKIAYVQRRSASDLVAEVLGQYRGEHTREIAEYEAMTKG